MEVVRPPGRERGPSLYKVTMLAAVLLTLCPALAFVPLPSGRSACAGQRDPPPPKARVDNGGEQEGGGGGLGLSPGPYVSPKSSISELLEYLGDHRTRYKATKQLMRRQSEVPASGLPELVKATCRLGNTQGCQKLLSMMRETGSKADLDLYDVLLRLANLRYLWDLALSLLNDMERDGVKPTEPMLSSTLHTCISANRPSEAINVLGRYHRNGLKPSLPALCSFIRYLSEIKEVQGLRKVAAAIQLMMLEGDANLYTTLVSAFGRAGSYDDVLSTAAMVEGKGARVLVDSDKGVTYATAVASLLEGNRTAEAMDLYRRGLDDGATYTTDGYRAMMRGAALSKEPGLSAFFLQELRRPTAAAVTSEGALSSERGAMTSSPTPTGTPPASSAIMVVLEDKALWKPISACARAGLLEETASLVLDYYLKVEGTATDAQPLRTLVRACAEAASRSSEEGRETGVGQQAVDLAIRVYETIEKQVGFVGDSYTTMVLIGGYRLREQYQEMVTLYENARVAGVAMWLPAVSNVMFALSKAGANEAALEVFQRTTATEGSSSSVTKLPGSSSSAKEIGMWMRVLSRATFLAAELRRDDVASTILRILMRAKTLRPGAKDYMNLIKAFNQAERPADALQVLMLMNQRKDSPSTLHYNAVLHAFSKLGRMEDAEFIFQEMKDRKVAPDAGTYTAMVSGFERARQPERALALYDEMKRLGVAEDKYLLSSIISVTADMRDRAKATGLLERFRGMASGDSVAASDVMYGSLMHAMARDPKSRGEVLGMLQEAKGKGIKPNVIMYNEALYTTHRLVRKDLSMADTAIALYRQMVSEGVSPDPLTYRRLFKCLRQACRFQDMVDISKSVDRDVLVNHDRIGVPLITACLKVGDQDRALDLLGGLMLKEDDGLNTTTTTTYYETYRWATWVYCTKINPPDVLAAESIMDIVPTKGGGWKLDRGFYGFVMQGHWRLGNLERIFDIYANLPPAFLGGSPAAVASLAHLRRGRLDRIPPLLRKMRDLDDPPSQPLAYELLEALVASEDWKIALEVLEVMVDFDMTITRQQESKITALAKKSAEGGGLEVLQGLSMLTTVSDAREVPPREHEDDE